ncbi:MAG: glycoside hydrolase, partial [Actinomycetia bacterium]|nr:glycoside hydrolase [Actinomycetes bacterium]
MTVHAQTAPEGGSGGLDAPAPDIVAPVAVPPAAGSPDATAPIGLARAAVLDVAALGDPVPAAT